MPAGRSTYTLLVTSAISENAGWATAVNGPGSSLEPSYTYWATDEPEWTSNN